MPLTTIEQETLSAVKMAARKYANQEIDWEQRRYEIAKDVLPTMLSKKYVDGCGYIYNEDAAIQVSVSIADKLIDRLKNKHIG